MSWYQPTVGAVATLLGMDRTTLTANLKPLGGEGPGASAVDPDDKRGRRIALTAKGMRRLKKALPIWQRTHEEVDRLLVPANGLSVRAGLRALDESY